MNDRAFTPALGRAEFTDSYDLAIRFATRERVWRAALLAQIALRDGETIVDVGCGTGTLALMLKRAAPGARVIALDPDPQVLAIAAAKAERDSIEIEWQQGFARDAASLAGSVDKAVSSLVFHQVPISEKRAGIAAMQAAVRSDGEMHIADYARQKSWLMRWAVRADGATDRRPRGYAAECGRRAGSDLSGTRRRRGGADTRHSHRNGGHQPLQSGEAPPIRNAIRSQKCLLLQLLEVV